MAITPKSASRSQFARSLREQFLVDASKAMDAIATAVQQRLSELVDEPCSPKDVQLRRDAWLAYKDARKVWVDLTVAEWRKCLEPVKTKKEGARLDTSAMTLVGTDEVENKILASRMVLAVNDKVFSELDDLRVRIKYLEETEDLADRDLFRPEVLVLLLVEQWPKSGMSSDNWGMVSEVVQRRLISGMKDAYKAANDALVSRGVLPVIELKDRVKAPRALRGGVQRPAFRTPDPAPPSDGGAEQGGQPYGDFGGARDGGVPSQS